MNGWYDVAQICLSGHVINNTVKSFPGFSKRFCDKCGEATITNCSNCNAEIQGYFHLSGIIDTGIPRIAPSFCHNCGKPYPWTEAKIQAARDLAKELEGISEEEKTILAQSIDDIVRDTPRTELAATRFKNIVAKAGKPAAEALRMLLVDIASETAKKLIKDQMP